MQWVWELWQFFQSVEEIVLHLLLEHPYRVLGALCVIILLESSVFPFLPGDTLLFASGFALRTSPLSVHVAVWLFLLASSLGVTVNYGLGRRLGDQVRTGGIWGFGRGQLKRTEHLIQVHGPRMLVLGRFLPGVRTAVSILAGTGKMPFGTFMVYNVLGGLPWVFFFTYAGYYLGGIPGIEAYMVPIALLLLAIGILPLLIGWARSAWRRSHPKN